MVRDASGSTRSTTCVELYSIEEGTILLISSLSSSFHIRFIPFGFGMCPPWSNDDSLMMISLDVIGRGVVILKIIIIVVAVVVIAPRTETMRMLQRVLSPPPMRGRLLLLLVAASMMVLSSWT